jgi:hypothetical protein
LALFQNGITKSLDKDLVVLLLSTLGKWLRIHILFLSFLHVSIIVFIV